MSPTLPMEKLSSTKTNPWCQKGWELLLWVIDVSVMSSIGLRTLSTNAVFSWWFHSQITCVIYRTIHRINIMLTITSLNIEWKAKMIISESSKFSFLLKMEIVILSEVRHRQISYDIAICGILKIGYEWTYLRNLNRVIDTENRLTVIRG